MAGADAGLVPGYGSDEIGAGYLQVEDAWAALQADVLGSVQDPLGPAPSDIVDISNVEFTTTSGPGMRTIRTATDSFLLSPGFKQELIFATSIETELVELQLTGVEILGPNPIGIDSLEVYVHNAKRGGTGFDYIMDSTNVFGDITFEVTDDNVRAIGDGLNYRHDAPVIPDEIEPGFFRIVIENDWTSNGPIAVDVVLQVVDRPLPQANLEFSGSVMEGEFDIFLFSVPNSVGSMKVFLTWENDWSAFPTHDLDLIVAHFDNQGNLDLLSFQGATLDAPERTDLLDIPKGGTWLVLVDGFTVFAGEDEPYTVLVFFE